MKSKNMKKVLAVTMSTTMVMGMSLTAFAEDTTPTTPTGGNVTAPIYSFDLTDVVVPTDYKVAFNPDELTVKVGTGASDTSTDQILSKNYGIVNKSTKDKIVSVELQVEDLNTGDNHVTFVDTAAEATGADKDEYAVYLAATPSDATEVKIGTASADKDTATAALADVAMTKATGQDVTMHSGSNQIAFKLEHATYSLKSGSSLELGNTTTNNVGNLYEVTALAGSGKGITGFTFTGAMNKNADWTKLTNGIKITAIYTNKTAGAETVLTGTGAMVTATAAPTFTDSTTNIGEISFTAGVGNSAFKELNTITAPWAGSPFDMTSYATVDATNGKITISADILAGWAGNGENPTATITYTTIGNEEKTATVTLLTHTTN